MTTAARRGIVIVLLGTVVGAAAGLEREAKAKGATATATAAAPLDPRELEAKKACLAGRVSTGIELLAALYAETSDPTYIYNQGRCFEQNGRAPEAVTRFREYLRKAPGVTADEKAEVQKHISELDAQTRASDAPAPGALHDRAAGAADLQGPAAMSAQQTVTPAGSSTLAAPPATDTPAAARDTRPALRIAGISAGVVGAVAMAVGLYMGMRARSLSREVTREASDGTFSRAKYDEGRRSETLQWVGYGLGAAGLLAGGVLFYLGSRGEGDEVRAVTALPAVSADTVGAAVQVSF